MTVAPSDKPANAALRSDEPIRRRDQDKLARAHLVEVISAHILGANAPESVVIALNAPWGAGKSSFLNLLEQQLIPKERHPRVGTDEVEGSPIIVRFNPWHYTNVDQLVRMFFGELARAIGTAGKKDLGKKIGELLQAAGSLAAIFSSGAGGLLKDAGGALRNEKSLPELKGELDKLLPDLAQRVVIFVDDIDRLERDALRLLFRVIRLNADFPNVTYVLAFDRLVVERHLDEENGIRGRDYLEKIIQVSFDIPTPEPSTIHRILFAEMDAVLDSLKTRTLDAHRWGNVFHSGFKEHFRTIRHIKRYANGLRLTLPPVAQEVDLVDFLCIELIRTFHPEVYLGVIGAKDILAPVHFGRRDGLPVERLKEAIEKLCSKASSDFSDSVRELLRQLFPELARAYENTTYADDYHSQWRRDCRVCAPEVFDKFFLLAIPEGEVSEIEIQSFVNDLKDLAATKEFLHKATESGKARRLMERLEDFTADLPLENVPRLVSILFDDGDQLRFESRGFLDMTADMQVARIIYQCLARLSSEEERYQLLLEGVKNGAGLYTLIQEVSLSEPKPPEKEGRTLSDHAKWETLREGAVTRIRAGNASGELWRIVRLPYVLFRWKEWTSVTEVQAAVTQQVATDVDLLAFLAKFVTESLSQTMGDKVSRKRLKVEKKALATFLNLESLTGRLRTMVERGGEATEVAQMLIAALERAPTHPWDE